MGDPPALKRPKLEKDDNGSTYCPRPASNGPGATAARAPTPRDDVEEGDRRRRLSPSSRTASATSSAASSSCSSTSPWYALARSSSRSPF
ncbi:unnamed protein product [Miscanthus lutarioriparius]|uniref:Uncharacterized protein n=1 Tax=Miscanthus lutarioriparius TaxID=422564 RepID=A0A811MPL9_9POAL|nr:unnamed protein product [Miscanthus lutarioriparius]